MRKMSEKWDREEKNRGSARIAALDLLVQTLMEHEKRLDKVVNDLDKLAKGIKRDA